MSATVAKVVSARLTAGGSRAALMLDNEEDRRVVERVVQIVTTAMAPFSLPHDVAQVEGDPSYQLFFVGFAHSKDAHRTFTLDHMVEIAQVAGPLLGDLVVAHLPADKGMLRLTCTLHHAADAKRAAAAAVPWRWQQRRELAVTPDLSLFAREDRAPVMDLCRYAHSQHEDAPMMQTKFTTTDPERAHVYFCNYRSVSVHMVGHLLKRMRAYVENMSWRFREGHGTWTVTLRKGGAPIRRLAIDVPDTPLAATRKRKRRDE